MPARVHPVLLRPDNFAPPSRTPWGGSRIVAEYKARFVSNVTHVGESWEISAASSFPSRVEDGRLLDAVIREHPHAWLGAHARSASTELLVKLIDACDDLSVQIHPNDDYAALGADECGKPECWYVVDRAPGAGFYVGLADGVDATSLRRALEDGSDVSALLGFFPVEPGDLFVIEPGTPHAIGRGVLLVEPQRVRPSREAITYRFWDWNRRYDDAGKPSPTGTPRTLHVEHAIAVTRFEAARSDALATRIRHRAGHASIDGGARRERLCGREGPAESSDFVVERLVGNGEMTLPSAPFLRGLTVLDGSVRIRAEDHVLEVAKGRSAVLPACLPTVQIELERAHAILAAVA